MEKDTEGLTEAQQNMLQPGGKALQSADRRADTLTRLWEVGQALASLEAAPGGLEQLLQQVAKSAQHVLSADVVTVYQYIQEWREFLVSRVLVGELREPSVLQYKVLADDVVVKIVQRASPLYSADAQSTPELANPFETQRPERSGPRFVVREGIVSSAAVPLRAGNEIVGVMFVNYRTPQLFTKEQREIIELFANQAAIAIRNARLFDLIRQQKDELQAKYDDANRDLEEKYRELERAYSSLKEEQERRIAAEKLRAFGQAATNLSHKMNNVGGIIPLCVQEIRELVGDYADARLQKNLDVIEQQAGFLLRAARDLRKPFESSVEVTLGINASVEKALEVTNPLWQSKVEVERRFCNELLQVKTRQLLEDAFVELITNAVKAMPDGGRLEIETRLVDGKAVEVSFTDTGWGIPQERWKRIFEPLDMFQPAGETARPGTRLGLWWVKTFLQQQGGDIELRWSEVGKGSTFVIVHPVNN